MNKIELVWLAAWLEGEGSFGQYNRTVSITATSTDFDIITKVGKLLGATTINKRKTKGKEYHSDAFNLGVYGKKAYTILKKIRPFMGIRRGERIDELINHYDGGKERRHLAAMHKWANPEFRKHMLEGRQRVIDATPLSIRRLVKLKAWKTRRRKAKATLQSLT